MGRHGIYQYPIVLLGCAAGQTLCSNPGDVRAKGPCYTSSRSLIPGAGDGGESGHHVNPHFLLTYVTYHHHQNLKYPTSGLEIILKQSNVFHMH